MLWRNEGQADGAAQPAAGECCWKQNAGLTPTSLVAIGISAACKGFVMGFQRGVGLL